MEEKVENTSEKKKKKSSSKGSEKRSTRKTSTDTTECKSESKEIQEKLLDQIEPIDNSDKIPTDEDKNSNDRKNSVKTPRDVINEILNPPQMEIDPSKPYNVPEAVKSGDVNALQDLDERKIIELKEAFLLFDLNGDGFIDADDLRATFRSLGDDNVSENLIQQMMSEAMNPLDFDSFIMLLGYKSIELDPEDILIEALSKWDLDKTGSISEEKIRHDLMCYGDRFTEKEVDIALEEAPISNKIRAHGDPVMIDYQQFCRVLGGLRKRKAKGM